MSSPSSLWWIPVLPGAGALLIAQACTTGGEPSSGPPAASETNVVVVNDGVVLLDSTTADDVAVLPGKLLFPIATHPDVEGWQAGEILVADRGKSQGTPNRTGFLRKVVSVAKAGTQYEVTTAPAVLTEVVRQGEFQVDVDTPPLTMEGPVLSTQWMQPGLSPQGPNPIHIVNFSGAKLLDQSAQVTILPGGKVIGYHLWATVATGTLDFTPKWDVGAKVEPDWSNLLGSLKEAHVIGTGTLDGELTVEAGLSLDTNATGEDIAYLIANRLTGSVDNTLVEYDFSLGSFHMGPVPLPVNGVFKASVICDFKWGGQVSVRAGGKAKASVTAGFRYENGSISPVWSKSASFEQVGPEWTINGDVYLKCSVHPEFRINLFDLAAGEVWADAYAAMRAQAICNQEALTGELQGEAFAGVSAAAHAKVDVFGLYKWEHSCSLFDIESARKTVTASWPLGQGATCSGSSATQFASTAHDGPEKECFAEATKPPEGTDGGLLPDGGTGGASAEDGSVADGAGGEAGCQGTTEPVPSKWTCEPERWGDCVCDCECGVQDADCQTGECSPCEHDVCTVGTALGLTCDQDGQGGACIAAICKNDSYCCTYAWTLSCIDHVEKGDFGCAPQACNP